MRSLASVNKQLGARWKTLTEAERQPFVAQAKEDQLLRLEDQENAGFAPRRRSRSHARRPLAARNDTVLALAGGGLSARDGPVAMPPAVLVYGGAEPPPAAAVWHSATWAWPPNPSFMDSHDAPPMTTPSQPSSGQRLVLPPDAQAGLLPPPPADPTTLDADMAALAAVARAPALADAALLVGTLYCGLC